MHEMLTILTDVSGVCLLVCLSVTRLKSAAAAQCTLRAVCAGSFGAVFAKCLWPLVCLYIDKHDKCRVYLQHVSYVR